MLYIHNVTNTPEKLREKLKTKYDVDENGCHIYSGGKSDSGHGIVWMQNKRYRAHRLMYELFVEPVPTGHVVRHKCDVPSCVNLDHLELGTQADNLRDMVARGRHWKQQVTHCPEGHPYSGENLYVNPSGGRQCRICVKAAGKASKERARRSRGAKPHLTSAQARAIRDEYSRGGVTQRVLAEKYGVTQPTVSAVVHGRHSD